MRRLESRGGRAKSRKVSIASTRPPFDSGVIEQLEQLDAVIVVAASAPTRTHVVSCLAAGAGTYVAKPVTADQLTECLAAA
jgi:CheY-like chemotaxis protein